MAFSSSGGRSIKQLLRCLRASSIHQSSNHSAIPNSISTSISGSSSSLAQIKGGGSSSSSSRCMCRAYSDYAAPGGRAAGSGLRRVNPGGSAANGSSTAEGAASTSGQSGSSASILEMKEVPGGSKPMRKWEYYYWGLGATGIAFLLYNRLKEPEKTPEDAAETERRLAELRVRRKDHVRAVVMQQNFLLGDDDPLEGLSPAQIVMFCEKYGIDPSDPLEGLTPEEIDAYMAQQEAKKQEQEDS